MTKIKINSVVASHYEEMMHLIATTVWENENAARKAKQEIILILKRLHEQGEKSAYKNVTPN